MTLRYFSLVLQAALGDGLTFNPFSLQQDGLAAVRRLIKLGAGRANAPGLMDIKLAPKVRFASSSA